MRAGIIDHFELFRILSPQHDSATCSTQVAVAVLPVSHGGTGLPRCIVDDVLCALPIGSAVWRTWASGDNCGMVAERGCTVVLSSGMLKVCLQVSPLWPLIVSEYLPF